MATSTFAGIYVLSIEWVSTKYRVLGSTIIALSFPLGEILLGFVAMYVHDFRTLIRILYTPGLAVIVLLWLVPESVRWLLVNGQVDRAVKILKRIASVNGKKLSEKSIEMMHLNYSATKANQIEKQNNKNPLLRTFCSILKSKILCWRLLNCCYLWIVCCFCYYGLSSLSTHISSGNRYKNFIFVAAIEVW